MDFHQGLLIVEKTVKFVIIQKNKLQSQLKDLQKQQKGYRDNSINIGIQNKLLKRRCREKDDLIHKRYEEIEMLMIKLEKMKKPPKTLKTNQSNDVSDETTIDPVSEAEEERNNEHPEVLSKISNCDKCSFKCHSSKIVLFY